MPPYSRLSEVRMDRMNGIRAGGKGHHTKIRTLTRTMSPDANAARIRLCDLYNDVSLFDS